MDCTGCTGIDLRVRCPLCGKVPDDKDAASMAEAMDIMEFLNTLYVPDSSKQDLYKCVKILIGVNISLTDRIKNLEKQMAN